MTHRTVGLRLRAFRFLLVWIFVDFLAFRHVRGNLRQKGSSRVPALAWLQSVLSAGLNLALTRFWER